LTALGDVDGENVRLDSRLAEGDAGRFPELAAALVRENPNFIVASGEVAKRAALAATRTVPIVASTNDLVGFIVEAGFPRAYTGRRLATSFTALRSKTG
jgi:putative ABC transport system substrate-binding protein